MFFYFIYFVLLFVNMIFFGILNIPLFKYFCDVPDLMFANESLNLIDKIYFVDSFNFFFSFYSYSFISNGTFLSFFFIYLFDFFYFYYNLFFMNYDFFLFNTLYDFIEINFQTSTSNFNFVEFIALQKNIYVVPNESHLIFFRMYNSVSYEITGISIYSVYPNDYLLFFNKIQCFCFEELLLYSYESIDLPVIFYISNDILNHLDFFYTNKLYLSYLFLAK